MSDAQLNFLQEQDHKLMSASLKDAIRALKEGRPILLLDDNERENEGDLVVAAEKIDSSTMNFLIKKGSGVVCLALAQEKLDQLGLPMMVPHNTNMFQTAFTVSIEAQTGVTTGVSARDRAYTIQLAMADDARPSDLRRPGHVFPLAAKSAGVFERMGHTEGSINLMNIAGLKPGAVLCELMNNDGSMAVGQERLAFAQEHGLPVVTVEEILFHRIKTESIFEKIHSKRLDTRFGSLTWHRFILFNAHALHVVMRENGQNAFPRLALTYADHLSDRLMAQIFGNNEDDPLYGALMHLADGKTDIVAVMPGNNLGAHLLSPGDERRNFAFVCRALMELSIKSLQLDQNFSALSALACEYFDMKIR